MSFGGGGSGGGSISGASDATVSNPATGDFLGYTAGSTQKWSNKPLSGTVALATSGGAEGLSALGSKTGAVTLDLSTANVFSMTAGGALTFTFSNAVANTACSFGLYIYAANGQTITWPAGTKWPNGTAPTLTGTASAPDVLVFETLNGGSSWFGSLVGNNYS